MIKNNYLVIVGVFLNKYLLIEHIWENGIKENGNSVVEK